MVVAWIKRTWNKLGRFPMFAIVGASGVGVNLVFFLLSGRFFGMNEPYLLVDSGIAFLVATTWNFSWNYVWTFRGMGNRSVGEHWFRYLLCSVAALAVNEAVLFLLSYVTSGLIAQLVGVLISCGLGYVLNRKFNFEAPVPAVPATG
jgi:putative flippase GtrA